MDCMRIFEVHSSYSSSSIATPRTRHTALHMQLLEGVDCEKEGEEEGRS